MSITQLSTPNDVAKHFMQNPNSLGTDKEGRIYLLTEGSRSDGITTGQQEVSTACDKYLIKNLSAVSPENLKAIQKKLQDSESKSEMDTFLMEAISDRLKTSSAAPSTTSDLRGMSSAPLPRASQPITNPEPSRPRTTTTTTQKPREETPNFARPKFLQVERLTGVGIIGLGIATALFAPVLGAVFAPLAAISVVAVPLVWLGSALIGASLIQQVVGNAPGCEEGKAKRVIAGVFFILAGPVGWIVGGVLWHLSNQENRP